MMHKKIGEYLKEKGLLTEAQLNAALRAQLQYGGHLGTCLLELGLIEEDTLGEALAQTASVPYASAKVLENLPPKTTMALPRKLAEKHRAVPIGVEEGTLHVCLLAPREIDSLDEIAFATGCRLKPWISPEARVYQALDRYYGVRRSTRYVTLCRSLDASASLRAFLTSNSVVRPKDKVREAPTTGDTAGASRPMALGDGMPDLGGEYGYGRCWKEIAADIDLEKVSAQAPAPDSAGQAGSGAMIPETPRPSLQETTDRLCRVESKQEAVDAVLDFTSARMARSIFFGVNDGAASAWDSRGSELDRSRISKAVFSVNSEKIFELLLGDDHYRGPLPPKRDFVGFYAALGMSPPKELLIFPVHFHDHLVGFFYGDGGPSGAISGETDEYTRLFRILPIAVNQIVLKDSMRTIGDVFSTDRASPK